MNDAREEDRIAVERRLKIKLVNDLYGPEKKSIDLEIHGTQWRIIVYDDSDEEFQCQIELVNVNVMDAKVNVQPIYVEYSFSSREEDGMVNLLQFDGHFNSGDRSEMHNIQKIVCRSEDDIMDVSFSVFFNYTNDLNLPQVLVPQWDILKDMADFLLDEKYSDVKLIVNQNEIPAHKIILSTSPVFAALMENNSENQIELEGVAYDIIIEVLNFLYRGEAPNIRHKAEDILMVADTYQLDRLKAQCEEVLMLELSEENVCDIFVKASLYNASQLRDGAKIFMQKHFIEVKQTEGFQKLAETHLYLLMDILNCYEGPRDTKRIKLPDVEWSYVK